MENGTEQYSVYCHRGEKKLEHIHTLKAEIRECEPIFYSIKQ